MRIIGDIHGNINYWLRVTHNCHSSIQIGDFGLGFNRADDNDTMALAHKAGGNKFIRGNHDSPEVCDLFPNYLGDWKSFPKQDLFVVGGEWSIDVMHRKIQQAQTGIRTWWPDEELTEDQFEAAYEAYKAAKPRFMVTHGSPREPVERTLGITAQSRTSKWFDRFFEAHSPDKWYFGHWHYTGDTYIDGCMFRCVGIDTYIDDPDIPDWS